MSSFLDLSPLVQRSEDFLYPFDVIFIFNMTTCNQWQTILMKIFSTIELNFG